MVVQVIGAPSKLSWWYPAIGQFAEVHEYNENTGYMRVRLMFPIVEYDQLEHKPYDRHRQIEGWIHPGYVKAVK